MQAVQPAKQNEDTNRHYHCITTHYSAHSLASNRLEGCSLINSMLFQVIVLKVLPHQYLPLDESTDEPAVGGM